MKHSPKELLTQSATRLAQQIIGGDLDSVQVVDAHIEHAESVNPQINAIICEQFEQARAQAKKCDQSRSRRKRFPEFFGVPCSIKENFAFAGLPQTSGMVSRRNAIASEDAPTVARIKAAGGIPIGTTNVPELCMWMETENKLYGRTNNPYDATRIVGGSSGGEGALIGSGASPFGLGADVGGSIRMPAFFNGIFGHKPSPGVVPNTGQHPLPEYETGRYCTTGPLARRAEDLYPLLKLLSGPDGVDPECRKKPSLIDPVTVRLDQIRVIDVPDNGLIPVSNGLRTAQSNAAGALAMAGAKLSQQRIPALKQSVLIWAAMMGAARGTSFTEQLSEGKPFSVTKELMKLSAGRSDHTLPAVILAGLEKAPPSRRHVEMGHQLRQELISMLASDGVMLFPSYSCTAPPHGKPLRQAIHWCYTAIINAMAFPVTQVPLGLDEQGLPLGVQVVAAPGQDHLTIAAALELERVFGGWVPPWQPKG